MSKTNRTDAVEEIERINLVRAAIYSFLSRAFKTEIDKEFLDDIIASAATVKLLAESQEGIDLVEGSQRLGRFVQSLRALSDDGKRDLIVELRLEFTNLFIGVGDDTVHLLESAYLNGKPARYDDPAQDVQTAYQSLGFKKDAEFYEPEDHVALEFEFMERICEWIVQALHAKDIGNATAYLSLQKEFLRDHVLRWVPKLCERLKSKAKSDFYSSLAYITCACVEMDYQMPDHLTAILRKCLS